MKTNKQRAPLSVEDVQAAAQTVKNLRTRMPLPPLTNAERQQYRGQRIGPRAMQQLQERLRAARQNPDLLPPAFDLGKFAKDAAMAAALDGCLTAVRELEHALQDSLYPMASQAKEAGDVVYGHLTVSTGSGALLQRKVDKLGRRGTRGSRVVAPDVPATGAGSTAPVSKDAPAAPAAAPPDPAKPKAEADLPKAEQAKAA